MALVRIRRRAPAVVLAVLAGAVIGGVVGCGVPQAGGPGTVVGGPAGGVSVDAQFERLADGGLRVRYNVSSSAEDPFVVADGVPADDTTQLPEVDPDSAYVRVRSGGTVEISRRTFAAPGRSDRSGTALMLGTVLAPDAQLQGTVTLPAPVRQYRPYDSGGERPELPDSVRSVVFCVGVVDPADVEEDLQAKADEAHPVLRHPTRQLLVCTPESDLPG